MSGAASTLTCRRVETLEGWAALEPLWNRLLSESAEATPWQSFEHLTCWWRHLAGTRLLRLYVVESSGMPLLILPLQLTTAKSSGVRLRWLEPIGMLNDINRPRLAIGRGDKSVYDCALARIWEDRREWDGVRLDERPLQDAECEALRRFARHHRLLFRQLPFHPCPYLVLDTSWEKYFETRGARLRKNLRAAERRLAKSGGISLRSFATPEEIVTGFALMLAIQQRSWKHDAGIGLSQSEAYRSYYREFLLTMARSGRCRILILYCGEQPVAGTIAITADGTYYSAQIAHDERYAECSVGTLLESLEFQDLFTQRRYRDYDFLGAALANKLRWTDTVRTTCRILVLKNSLRLRLLDAWWLHVKPVIKKTRYALTHRGARLDLTPGETLPF